MVFKIGSKKSRMHLNLEQSGKWIERETPALDYSATAINTFAEY